MANKLGLWNETFGLGSEEFQISNIEDHAVPIFKLKYWQLDLLICYYLICAIIAIVGEALVIFYIMQHAPKERPLNRMILIDQGHTYFVKKFTTLVPPSHTTRFSFIFDFGKRILGAINQ